jgi:predicted ATPase
LINFLRNKNILLILDNCEHLLDACAQLSDTILKQCPALKILATSRQVLGIMGEVSYRVPSLALPNSQELFENIKTYESMRLFTERAQLAQSDFTLTKENASSVAEICSRLDGIPLAIELAAAQIVIFSTEQIAARLHESFNLLASGSRTALPRQQTIRASIDWSWNLSTNAEQTLLQRLSVFSGGWNLESAEGICIGHGIETIPVLELMTQLVAKSLANVNQGLGGERRFHLHEAIRQYAYEKLIDAGEAENIHSQHLKYFLGLAEQDGPTLHGPQQTEWFSRINNERGNIRAALEFASKTNLEGGLYLAGGLTRYWNNFDLREGLSWTTEFIHRPESQKYPQARAKALLAQGVVLWYLQQFDAAHSAAQECLELFRACNDQRGEFDSLMLMGSVMQFLEGMDRKSEFHEKALALAQSIGDEWMQAMAQAFLGWDQRNPQQANEYREKAVVLFRQVDDWRNLLDILSIFGFSVLSNGDSETAKKYFDEAFELGQRMNDKRGMEFVLTGRSQMALMHGDFEQARAFLQENINFLEEMGNRMGVLWAKARLGYVALREGSENEAGRLLADTIMNFHKDRNKSGLVFTLDKVASLYVVTRQLERAARLLGWSDMTRVEIGDPRPRIEQVDVDHDIETICMQIGSTAFEEIYDDGRTMAIEDVVAYSIAEIRL